MEIEMCNKILKNTIYIYIYTYIYNIIKKITQIKISTFTTFQQTQTYFFFNLGFTPCKTEQPLCGMELQEKEAQKG